MGPAGASNLLLPRGGFILTRSVPASNGSLYSKPGRMNQRRLKTWRALLPTAQPTLAGSSREAASMTAWAIPSFRNSR